MTKYLYTILVTLILSLATASISLSAEVTLSWDASPSAAVQGYYVYYKQNNADLPFDGTGANEGPSPINVGNNLTATVTGLSNSGTYYFAITAYDSTGTESTYSNIVSSSSAVPVLLAPADKASNEPLPVTFQWSTTPETTYTLYYGTDPNLAFVPAPQDFSPANSFPARTAPLLLAIGLILLSPALLLNRKKVGYASAALALGLVLAACGGGDGGDSGITNTKTTTPVTGDGTESGGGTAQQVYSVDVGTTDYYQAYDLQPGTTYYWKVVGTDINDPSKSYTSSTSLFTTENP